MQKTTDRVKTRNSFSVNLNDFKIRIPLITIERIEELYPELWQQGYVKFDNSQNQKKKEKNFNGNICRKIPKKESVAASEMWDMALKENQHRKWQDLHTCPFCDRHIQTRWSLRRHIRTHCVTQVLQSSSNVANGLTRNSCSICGKGFLSEIGLRSHMAVHDFQCKVCETQFTELRDLKQHLQSHSQEPLSYRCEKCSETFASKSDLDQHSVIHTSIKSFSCKMCNTEFTSEQSLNIHKKQHDIETHQSNVAVPKNSKWMVLIHSWPSSAS